MKRLLAYLFIVLGLGLTFSVNAEAETTVKLVFKGQYVCLEGDTNCGQFSSGPISFHKWKSRKSSFNENGLCMSPEFGTVFYLHTIDNCDHYEKTYSKKYYRLTNLKDNLFKIDGYLGVVAIKKFADPTGQGEGSSVVKIAKVEPSQTQKVAKKGIKIDLVFCSDAGYKGVYLGTKCPSSRKNKINYTNYLKQNSNLCYLKNNPQELKIIQTETPCNSIYDKSGIPITHKGNGNFYVYGIDSLDIQIAKKDPTVKPKKKVKVEKTKNIKKNDNDILFSINDDFIFDESKELWHAIVVHKNKINIYRSDINSKINTKDKAINNATSKCWFDPQYTSGDWPSENCEVYFVSDAGKYQKKYKLDNKTERLVIKKKLMEEMSLIQNPDKILSKGITLDFLGIEHKTYAKLRKNKIKKEEDNLNEYVKALHRGKKLDQFNLEDETLPKIIVLKRSIEEDDINEYLNANIEGSDLTEFNLEKETLELVKFKRQERKEKLYAKTCTGIIFGHKKGTDDWYKCLDEEEAKFILNDTKTSIVKKEQTTKLKKKVKIAKVEDSTQEEFKPEKTNQDNEAPVIEIAEAITVNDTSYILEGRVTDKADKIFVEIDGQPVQVKKGKFKVKRYSPVDEQIKIVAIDQWGNKSKTKLVNITIDIEETIVANKLEPLNPSNISNKSSNNKVALIIGIENYTEAPKANYANLDAKYFFDYARRAFGVNKQNINLLVNEEATVVKTDKAVSLWLKSKIKKNKSDLIIFFAGHGLASSDGKELYLLPQDGNPDRLERTALSRTDLFKEIISLNPKSVTMFLDTCYSGVSRDEQMLLASARPVRIVADDQEGIPDNFTIFSASQLDQISSGLKEANHGIFSYYLMKGLEGKADSNQDKKITNGELLAYMDENVSQKASELGRQQNPSLAGDPDKVLMSYR